MMITIGPLSGCPMANDGASCAPVRTPPANFQARPMKKPDRPARAGSCPTRPHRGLAGLLPLLSAALLLFATGSPSALTAQSGEDLFESRVRPVLAGQCAECHRQGRTRGRLRVTSLDDLLKGGATGPAIVPGDPDASLLLQVVRHEIADLEMPQDAPKLSDRDIEGIAAWIQEGAPWPEASPTIVFAAAEAGGGLSPAERVFVERVRPVLEQKCWSCHTNDERGGLRLDSRDRILQGGGRGPAVVPGNPEQSLIITALRHTDADLQMPRNAAKLSDREIEGFIDWIQAGAEWAEAEGPIAIPRRAIAEEERAFWSFQPLADPEIPTPSGSVWARTDIDRFILARHEAAGVEAVGFADKRTLIRRATFDLIGLPPTPAEIDAFLEDDSDDAFETVVERLLASEHYGERWGRHWLDVTRFGEDDTRGLAEDGSGRERYPMAYVHRDWVVDAFNADMPFDTFAMAHLAADQMPEDRRSDLLPGLGFLGQGPWYYDLANPPVARADERHDRVDVTSRGFLGLTVGCARCHDHKYDPIGTHDYYSFAGVFNNANYKEYPVAADSTAERFEKDKEFIEQVGEGLGDYLRTESEQLARVLTLQTARYMKAAWKVSGKEQMPSERAATADRLDLETLERWIDFLDDPPKHYPFLTDWQAMVADEGGTEERADELAEEFQRLLLEVVAEQDELEELNQKIIARGTPLEEVKSTPMPNGFESFFDEHQLELETMERERFNLYLDVFAYDLDNELDTFFPKPALLRFSGWGLERQLSRVAADHVAATRETVEELEEALPDIPFVMGVEDKDPGDLVDIPLHIRGSPTNLGERVPRSFLHVLDEDPEIYTAGSGRLQLAQDIVDHPITARVIVNRVWAWHMGEGIVRTPSNFGFAGAPASHPELLDHLAKRFVEGGMSIKQLHRDIMKSSVYQLAATDNPAYADTDPDNTLFWRFKRQRLSAEGIRDALLAVSGELDDSIGGPSLELDDPKNDRRTLYGSVSRFQPHIFLQTFDFPSPSLTAEKRFSTNVPLQSLYFMNSPFVLNQVQSLVRRLADEVAKAAVVEEEEGDGGSTPPEQEAPEKAGEAKDSLPRVFDDRAMIERAYPLLYGRDATEPEIELGLEFLTEQRASWTAKAEEEARKKADEEEAAKAAATAMSMTSDSTGTTADSTATAEPASGADADPVAAAAEAEADAEKAAADEAKAAAEAAASEAEARELAERKASMEAWTQYARALISAIEFRFIA